MHVALIFLLPTSLISAQSGILDVVHYQLELKPDIVKAQLSGHEIIWFRADEQYEISLACGDLEVMSVQGEAIKSYKQKDHQLILSLSQKHLPTMKVEITYRGHPRRGLFFHPESMQMHTVFSTDQWMICNMAPSDRAMFDLNITLPDTLIAVSSGMLKTQKTTQGKTMYHWSLETPSPAYTYGLCVGSFQHVGEEMPETMLHYYATDYTASELVQIFRNTADMLHFFERKSGIPYFQKTYSQVMIGNNYQEMAGFSALKSTYGDMILHDSAVNLLAHELAHQWWGNMITCEEWTDFWLNEGFATYMSAAYNEHAFGKSLYAKDIDTYRKLYEQVIENGGDKSLVFENWNHPTRDDRRLVYYKGAYVLHLLREELGDEVFWKAISEYSQAYWGRSVKTQNFIEAIEKSCGRDLTGFFDLWVYNIH